MIGRAENFDQLFEIIKREERLVGSSGRKYSSEYLIDSINKVRNNLKTLLYARSDSKMTEGDILYQRALSGITRSEGLRDKVSELVKKEGREYNMKKIIFRRS